MSDPTKQAMRAALALDDIKPSKRKETSLEPYMIGQARQIDRAAKLPLLLAQNKAMREALEKIAKHRCRRPVVVASKPMTVLQAVGKPPRKFDGVAASTQVRDCGECPECVAHAALSKLKETT